MSKYKIICIDMFQTLVNIDARVDHIWKRILKNDYSVELQNMYVGHVTKTIINRFHLEFSKRSDFRNLRAIFTDCFKEIFDSEGVDYCPNEATRIFIEEHNKAEMYEDSLEFIRRAGKKYKVCLVSDADLDMVESHIDRMGFHDLFISEKVKSYKGNLESRVFRSVLEYYNATPNQIIHIGDSSSDIMGASNEKIDTCWINRHGYKKRFDITPTYGVDSLEPLYSVLDI